jgi:NTP pyrophosphatase (non-canonical NTP hydrolase)
MSGITLWKPEPDVIIHQALGKLVEELGELTQIAARCMIQGFDASEPVTGVSNRRQLQKEMADVLAALEWASEITGVSEDTDRVMSKLDGFRRWQKMLEEDMRSPAPLEGDAS